MTGSSESKVNLESLFLNFFVSTFCSQSPKTQIPCVALCWINQFSTINIVSVSAPGIPVKCHTFSPEPLCHTGISLLTATGSGFVFNSISCCPCQGRTQQVVPDNWALSSQQQKPHLFLFPFQQTYPHRSIPARLRVLVNKPAVALAVGIFKYSSFQMMAFYPPAP